ncbi:MAG TPA: PIN domain-containing protein [Oceanobacillus sp.]|nr:PIN domain-containing protein [Oceanobacillus sp.]
MIALENLYRTQRCIALRNRDCAVHLFRGTSSNLSPKVRDIFRQIDQGKFEGVSSMITLVEVLTQPLKMGNSTLEMEYRNILMRSRHFSLLPISVGIAERAAQLRAHYNLKTPDALQVFAAIDAQCDAFLTNDLGLKRVQEINVLLIR